MTRGDWGVPTRTQVFPPGAPADTAAIIIGPDLPPCMQADYAAAVLFRPPGSVSADNPYYFMAQRSALDAGQSRVDFGWLQYDPAAGLCRLWVTTQNYGSVSFGQLSSVTVYAADAPVGTTLMSTYILRNAFGPTSWISEADNNDFTGIINWGAIGAQCITVEDYQSVLYTSTSTSYTDVGAVYCGVVFTVPPNGRVALNYGGRMRNGTAGISSFLTLVIREGNTIGSGTTVLAAADDNATDHAAGANQSDRQEVSYLFDTGTPGSVYNAFLMHRAESGTSTFSRRHIMATPVL